MKPNLMKVRSDVGIVGSGPVGIILSGLLRRYGIGHILIDRRKDPVLHPQAHFLNARSMEIVQSFFPVEYDNVVDMLPNSKYWRDFSYCHSLVGSQLHRVNQFTRANPSFWQSSPSNVAHLAQNKFETVLRAEANKQPSGDDQILHYLKGYNVTKCSFDSKSSIIHAECASTTDTLHQSIEVECKYLIAADGANSMVRRSLGIEMIGDEAMQHLVNVHFSCPGLRKYLQPRPAMLYFTFNETMVAVFVAHDAISDEWVCQIPYFPPFQDRKDFTEAVVRKLIAAAIGTSALPLEIKSINSWVMHAQVAAQYCNTPFSNSSTIGNNHSNVFLIGDAAHRFPPSGGFGMNTGIQDAHNLAWKLALVLRGKADPKLLTATYEAERKPVAQANTKVSLHNYGLTASLAAALGVDPALATTAVATADSTASRTLVPFSVRRAAVLQALQAGLYTLKWLKDWESNMLGGVRVRAMRNRIDAGKSLPLIFPEVDLDYQYTHGGVVKDSTYSQSGPFTGLRLQVGGRLPHCWLAPTELVKPSTLVISSVQLPSLVDLLKDKDSAATCTPSLLLLVDRASTESAMSAVAQLSPSLRALFRVVSITNNLDAQSHSDLQKRFQVPHFIISETNPEEEEHPGGTSFIHRFHDVLTGNILPRWTDPAAESSALEFTCLTGRWREITQTYLQDRASKETQGKASNAQSLGAVVRPDGHVAHVICFDDRMEASKKVDAIKLDLKLVVDVLYLQ